MKKWWMRDSTLPLTEQDNTENNDTHSAWTDIAL